MKKNRIERVARGEGKSVVFEKKALKSAKKKSKRSVSRKKWVSRRAFLKVKIEKKVFLLRQVVRSRTSGCRWQSGLFARVVVREWQVELLFA